MQKSCEEAEPVRRSLLARTVSRVRNVSLRVRRLVLGHYDRELHRLAAIERRLDDYAQRSEYEAAQTSIGNRLAALEANLDSFARQMQVRTFMDWIPRASVSADTLVSVVLPTRDRRAFLDRAIQSVIAQTYANWELLIVDDGSVDDTLAYLDAIEDPRVKVYRSEGRGACAARNVAMEKVTGDIVAYLDDDNIMHPEWLKSVVWAFSQRPDSNVVYGAFLVDDPARIDPRGSGDLPVLFFFPYDHRNVAIANIADIGCISHRSGLAEARFDETLREMGDWDLFLRLTRDAPPLALPAVACFYTTDAPNRLSNGPTFTDDLNKVREKNRR